MDAVSKERHRNDRIPAKNTDIQTRSHARPQLPREIKGTESVLPAKKKREVLCYYNVEDSKRTIPKPVEPGIL